MLDYTLPPEDAKDSEMNMLSFPTIHLQPDPIPSDHRETYLPTQRHSLPIVRHNDSLTNINRTSNARERPQQVGHRNDASKGIIYCTNVLK